MKKNYTTPMMQQYEQIKGEHPNTILLFRLGDFYEMFEEDAKIGSEILGITLTKRANKDRDIPMCGIPYHALDNYLYKLVSTGQNVAICEQVSNPKDKGIVKREVVRIVTPGTILNDEGLNSSRNNYIAAINTNLNTYSIVIADLSTSKIHFHENLISKYFITEIQNFIQTFMPSEILVGKEIYNSKELLGAISSGNNNNIQTTNNWPDTKDSEKFLQQKFNIKTLESFDLHDKYLSQNTLHSLIVYVENLLKKEFVINHGIKKLQSQNRANINALTIHNLEIFNTYRTNNQKASLFNILNKTSTPMGARTLRFELINPLIKQTQIEERLNVTSYFYENFADLETYKQTLKHITDIERITSRINFDTTNPRELVALKDTIKNVFYLKEKLEKNKLPNLLNKYITNINPNLKSLVEVIENTLTKNPPITTREGKMINEGVDTKLDELKFAISNSTNYLKNLEKTEKERTKINTLKVQNNKVFGYYIEVSKAQSANVPDDYERKQTLVNAERYITPELKKHEALVFSAEETIHALEYEIFVNLVKEIKPYTKNLLIAAESIGMIDMFISFGEQAVVANYERPKITTNQKIILKKSRHPVVETLQNHEGFTPNNLELNKTKKNMVAIITGPNMSGKSTFIRQVAINVLMAQCGMFVPSSVAEICPRDGIYTRLGANDELSEGLSTFMVEMVETALILNNATENSLVIFDEVGRGTSTYDGISIAYSILELLVKDIKAYTLFATHYHELTSLAQEFEGIFNLQVKVDETDKGVRFTHEVIDGSASKSYGIHVAEKAGIPKKVTQSATKILASLEEKNKNTHATQLLINLEPEKIIVESKIEEDIKNIDINNLTPIQALELLNKLKKELGN